MSRCAFLHMMALVVVLQLSTSTTIAETRISGYASIVAGRVVSGERFLSDFPKTGILDEDISFTQDTSIGLQLSTDVNDRLSFILQMNSHGAQDFETELSWAYLNYQITPELSIQAGRKRLPLYYYSDYFDVGYAYVWIRPPVDNYTWQISNYNGISLLYETHINGWDSSINFYIGREDSEDNELMSFLMDAQVDETWKNIVGVVGDFSRDWLNFRLTVMGSELDRVVDGSVAATDAGQEFAGLSLNLYFDQLTILTERNFYKRDVDDIAVDTYLLSVAYKVGDFTPYTSFSRFEQEINLAGGDECHDTKSLGLRWDFSSDAALKIQFDKVTDKGVTIPLLGDSESVSIGIDMVF